MAVDIEIGNPSEFKIGSNIIRDFYKKNWNREICLSNESFYKWQFSNLPYAKNDDDCCIAISEGEVIAVMGVNSRRFWSGNGYLDGAELTTWIVREDYQNQGVGPKILNSLQKKYNVLLGMGITDAALGVYMRLGFRYKKSIPRFIKVVAWNTIDAYSGPQIIAKKIDNFWKKNIDLDEYIDIEFDEVAYNKIYSKYKNEAIFFDRSIELIKWRYLKHPFFKYELKIISNKKNKAESCFLAYRIDKTESGINIIHVMDMFGSNKSISACLRFLEQLAIQENIHVIDYYSTNIKQHGRLLKSGWFSTLDDYFFKFPHLFHPIEYREPATTSMVIWSRDDEVIYDDFSKLYITKQDADFDRPSAKMLE